MRPPFSHITIKAHQLENLAYPSFMVALDGQALEWLTDDAGDTHLWVERTSWVLEDDLHFAAECLHVCIG